MLEWDQNPNAIRDELLKEPLRLEKDGTVKVPERPGLGIELDAPRSSATGSGDTSE